MAIRKKLRLLLLLVVSFMLLPSACGASPLLVNLSHPLQPYDYMPPQLTEPVVPTYTAQLGKPESELTPAAAKHLQRLFAAATLQNLSLILSSGYRSFAEQQQLFQQAQSRDKAQASVAPPGFSEHQTGLAADVATSDQFCVAQQCFMLTRAAAWLAANAHIYGFIIRYPRDKTAITGYEYEPWHLRYVGQSPAEQIYNANETLEDYVSRASASP